MFEKNSTSHSKPFFSFPQVNALCRILECACKHGCCWQAKEEVGPLGHAGRCRFSRVLKCDRCSLLSYWSWWAEGPHLPPKAYRDGTAYKDHPLKLSSREYFSSGKHLCAQFFLCPHKCPQNQSGLKTKNSVQSWREQTPVQCLQKLQVPIFWARPT